MTTPQPLQIPGQTGSPDKKKYESAHHDMVRIPATEFLMGSDNHYPEERPAHRVRVDAFWMDRGPVTNARFREFVDATGHVTFAELAPKAEDYPGALPEMLYAGSLVFEPPAQRVNMGSMAWWQYVRGADWKHPRGPGSNLEGLDDHPVVHVTNADARAFAAWEGKDLPTEAEWECAARGGLDGATYAWGEELMPRGRIMANTWHGEFPYEKLMAHGHRFTSPVGAFPPNGYGLHDMIGNVWEWTSDWFRPRHPDAAIKSCCIPRNPRAEAKDASYDPREVGTHIPRMVLKGGSHLCAPNYCRRYRPAARHPEPVDTSTSHVGFRCIVREDVLRMS